MGRDADIVAQPPRKPVAICPHCRRVVEALPLSWREAEVLKWLSRGETPGVIAMKMFISRRTVDTHIRSLYLKTGASNHVALVLWAMKQTLITLWDEA